MRAGTIVYVNVMKLVAKFGVPSVGTMIDHADICQTLSLPRHHSRMIEAMKEWRNQLYAENRVLLVNVYGKGYKSATSYECMLWAKARLATARRFFDRATNVIEHTQKKHLSKPLRMVKDEFTFKTRVAKEMNLFEFTALAAKRTSTYRPASAKSAKTAGGSSGTVTPINAGVAAKPARPVAKKSRKNSAQQVQAAGGGSTGTPNTPPVLPQTA